MLSIEHTDLAPSGGFSRQFRLEPHWHDYVAIVFFFTLPSWPEQSLRGIILQLEANFGGIRRVQKIEQILSVKTYLNGLTVVTSVDGLAGLTELGTLRGHLDAAGFDAEANCS